MSTTPSDSPSLLLVEALTSAIRSDGVFNPNAFPALSLEQAYKAQAEIFQALGKPLQGSKLTFKADVCHSAPLLSVETAAQYPFRVPVGIEVELAFRLGHDIGAGSKAFTRSDIVDAIGSVQIGVEVARSRYEGGGRSDLGLGLPDMLTNESYILGPSLDRQVLDEGADLGRLTIVVGGKTVFDTKAVHPNGDPLGTMISFANTPPPSGLAVMTSGQIITTGSLCGMIPVGDPSEIVITFGGQRMPITLAA